MRGFLDIVSTAALLVVAFVFVKDFRAPKGEAAPGLTLPALPTVPLALGPETIGSPTAQTAIVVFSDFECPYCRQLALGALGAVRTRLVDTGLVKLGFRHAPFNPSHGRAKDLALVAECARQQGRFWQMHDELFRKPAPPAPSELSELARVVGLSLSVYDRCKAGGREAIDRDATLARELQVRGTPTSFVGAILPDGRLRVSEVIVGAAEYRRFESAVSSAAVAR